MKKVIDGRLYDTSTATLVADLEYGAQGDAEHVYEALYLTPRGRFFLGYQGGALSRYGVSNGPHMVGGSSGIRPLYADAARDWCERADVDADAIARLFKVEEA